MAAGVGTVCTPLSLQECQTDGSVNFWIIENTQEDVFRNRILLAPSQAIWTFHRQRR